MSLMEALPYPTSEKTRAADFNRCSRFSSKPGVRLRLLSSASMDIRSNVRSGVFDKDDTGLGEGFARRNKPGEILRPAYWSTTLSLILVSPPLRGTEQPTSARDRHA